MIFCGKTNHFNGWMKAEKKMEDIWKFPLNVVY